MAFGIICGLTAAALNAGGYLFNTRFLHHYHSPLRLLIVSDFIMMLISLPLLLILYPAGGLVEWRTILISLGLGILCSDQFLPGPAGNRIQPDRFAAGTENRDPDADFSAGQKPGSERGTMDGGANGFGSGFPDQLDGRKMGDQLERMSVHALYAGRLFLGGHLRNLNGHGGSQERNARIKKFPAGGCSFIYRPRDRHPAGVLFPETYPPASGAGNALCGFLAGFANRPDELFRPASAGICQCDPGEPRTDRGPAGSRSAILWNPESGCGNLPETMDIARIRRTPDDCGNRIIFRRGNGLQIFLRPIIWYFQNNDKKMKVQRQKMNCSDQYLTDHISANGSGFLSDIWLFSNEAKSDNYTRIPAKYKKFKLGPAHIIDLDSVIENKDWRNESLHQ